MPLKRSNRISTKRQRDEERRDEERRDEERRDEERRDEDRRDEERRERLATYMAVQNQIRQPLSDNNMTFSRRPLRNEGKNS